VTTDTLIVIDPEFLFALSADVLAAVQPLFGSGRQFPTVLRRIDA